MVLNLLYLIGLLTTGFLLSLPVFIYTSKNNYNTYSIKKDVWIYMWILMLISVCGLSLVMPDFYDIIVPIKLKNILIPFVLSAIIYIIYLLETNWLLYLTIALSSAVITFTTPENLVLFENIPFYADRLIIFSSLFIITFFSKILNGMSAAFGIFVVTILCGICLLSLIGGLPLSFGFVCGLICGIWIGFLRYNWYPSEVYLNDGACTSAGFLIGCLFLYSSFEYATGSILVLGSYLWTEILLVLSREYVFRIKETDFYNNTSYYVCYTKDIPVHSILISLSKIGVINVIFAGFQVYSSNEFSLPVFTIIADLWLINTLFHASEENKSFKQINQSVFDDVKSNFKSIKDTFTKGKE